MFHHHNHPIRRAFGRTGEGFHLSGRSGFGEGGDRGSAFGRRHRDDIPGGRKLGAEDLQLVILALLDESPAHGYEIIRRLETRSNGFYKPSPGMVYPALTYLEEIDQTEVTREGTRKLYSLTGDGRTRLSVHRVQADAILAFLSRIGSRMSEVREAFSGLHDADPAASDTFHMARHALKTALHRMRGSSPAEIRRIADILNRATADILGQPTSDSSDGN